MKKILVSLICCLTATLGWAQEKNAYTLFDAQGNRVDYTQMMDVLERQDVVFIGEIHNCPIAHWMEYEIVKDLYDRHGDRLMIGAEMFERDDPRRIPGRNDYPRTVQRRSQALAQLQDRLLSDRRIRQRAQDSLRRHERSTPLRQHGRQRRIRGAGRAFGRSETVCRTAAPELCAQQERGRIFRGHENARDETERRRKPFEGTGGQRRYDGLVDRRTDAVETRPHERQLPLDGPQRHHHLPQPVPSRSEDRHGGGHPAGKYRQARSRSTR